MKTKNILLLILPFTALLLTGCYGTLRGRVIDAETGAPIEGAVAMAEWTKTKGLGNTYTVSAKVVEAISDKDGNIELEGCYSPFVNEPDLTIYKKGYVAWNNKYIFPNWKKRDGFEWNSRQNFKIELFGNKYTHTDHVRFIRQSINYSLLNKKKKSIESSFDWETKLSIAE